MSNFFKLSDQSLPPFIKGLIDRNLVCCVKQTMNGDYVVTYKPQFRNSDGSRRVDIVEGYKQFQSNK